MNDIELAILEFDWDHGNIFKIIRKHDVDPKECEEVFANRPIVGPDVKHSDAEERFIAYGQTYLDRKLMLVFTIRRNKIRVVSARPMNRRERNWYETQEA